MELLHLTAASEKDFTYAYCGTNSGLLILDATNPYNLREITFLNIGDITDIAFFKTDSNTYDYAILVYNNKCLYIADISEPKLPRYAGGICGIEVDLSNIAINGDYAYLTNSFNGLLTINIVNPDMPQYINWCYAPGESCDIAISGNSAYGANGDMGLAFINLDDPSNPSLDTFLYRRPEVVGYAHDLAIIGDYIYVADGVRGLAIINKNNKIFVGEHDTPGTACGIAIKGNYAYIADGQKGLAVIDIIDPNNPEYVNQYDTNVVAIDVTMTDSDSYAYIVDKEKGLLILDVSDPNEFKYVNKYDKREQATGIAVEGNYIYLADRDKGLAIIDVFDPTNPVCSGRYDTQGCAYDVTIYSNKAYVADGNEGLVIIDISDPNKPAERFATQGCAFDVAVNENYICVADGDMGLMVIHRSDPNKIDTYDTPGIAFGVTIYEDNKAYVADGASGLAIIDLNDPNKPIEQCDIGGSAYAVTIFQNYALNNYACVANGKKGLAVINIDDPNLSLSGWYDPDPFGCAYDVTVSNNAFAYVADGENGLVVIHANDPNDPLVCNFNACNLSQVGHNNTKGKAQGIALDEDRGYAYMADSEKGLFIFKIIEDPPPEGNLILCAGGPSSSANSLWHSSQALANLAYTTFLDQNYPGYFMYYINPDPHQDINGDGIFDSLIVDDIDLTEADLNNAITNLASGRINTGPLHLYLTGLGKQDIYQISPGEILKASDPNNPNHTLNAYLDEFQADSRRDIICLLEFSSSGSFCDHLIDPDTTPYSRTIIACTDKGSSYLDVTGNDSFSGVFLNLLGTPDSLTFDLEALFTDTGISHYQRVKHLQCLFSQAREIFWNKGYPFSTQPPQMVTAQGASTLCSITLAVDFNKSFFPYTDTNQIRITNPNHSIVLKAIGHYLDGNHDLAGYIYYQSSDESIVLVTQEGEVFANPETNYNGKVFILGTIIDPNFSQSSNHDPNMPPIGGVTGRLNLEVDIPGRKEKEGLPKAIIIAGRCEDRYYHYDYLWNSTNKMANHAYNVFIDRGYSHHNIYYLSHDPNQMGVDGKIDDNIVTVLDNVFTDPNNHFLDGLTDLTIFLIDHGKHNKFILGPTDENFLSPMLLDHWLDEIQASDKYPDAKITIIIEACYSGCFLESLMKDSENRIVVTSTQDTSAYLAANGVVSFSYFLFNNLKSGANLADAFERANFYITSLKWRGIQTPILEDNPNGQLAVNTLLGQSFILSQDQPQIIQTSLFNDPILPNTEIDLWARVTDLDGIKSVWAVISASQNSLNFSGSTDDPIVGLPKEELRYNDDTDRYEGTYHGFPYSGPYTILFFAQDTKEMVSCPKTVFLNVLGGNKDEAFLIYDDPNMEKYALIAEEVLQRRRFSIENIHKKLIEDSNDLSFIDSDNHLDHLLLYFILQDANNLDPNYVDAKVDHIQQDSNCNVIIIIDANCSGRFLKPFSRENERKRIIITSTDENHPNHRDELPPFSQFFFSSIYNGVNINQAFTSSRLATGFFSDQNPLLDDNGDGCANYYNENWDGKFARSVYLGSPFEYVQAGPKITVPEAVHINGWETSTEIIWAQVEDPNSRLWAVIHSPQGEPEILVLNYDPYDPNKHNFKAEYSGFKDPNVYQVLVYSEDQEGLIDYDESTYIVLKPDSYEVDNTSREAKLIKVNQPAEHHTHNFHRIEDIDWVYFHGYADRPYEIYAESEWQDYPLRLDVYAPDGTYMGNSPYVVGFSASLDGLYFVRVSYTCSELPPVYPSYQLRVVCNIAGEIGGILGRVVNSETSQGIVGAQVCFKSEEAPATMEWCVPTIDSFDFDAQELDDPDFSVNHIEAGFYITQCPSGKIDIAVKVKGEIEIEYEEIDIPPNSYIERIFCLDENIPAPISIDPNDVKFTIDVVKQRMGKITLHKGLNLFSLPDSDPNHYKAKTLLEIHLNSMKKIMRYNNANNSYEVCYSHYNNQEWSYICSDKDFPIIPNEGSAVYMKEETTIEFSIPIFNSAIDLQKGMNWVAIPSPPPFLEYTSHIMLQDIGSPEEILCICDYDSSESKWSTTYWIFNEPRGDNFPIRSGKGYIVFMKKEKLKWLPGFIWKE